MTDAPAAEPSIACTLAEGDLNGGGPILKVRTTTGDIAFRRAGH